MHPTDVSTILPAFQTIDLRRLAAVDFEGRVDTKFVFPHYKLADFLKIIENDAVLLEVNGERLFHYRNIYLDTEEYSFFAMHRAGRKNRLKIRARAYHSDGPFVFEIKRKNNKGLTIKKRISLPSFDDVYSTETEEFLQSELGKGFDDFPRHTVVNYSRMTFANKAMTEKFTIDIQLHTRVNEAVLPFMGIVIAELKQPRFKYDSIFMRALKHLRIYPGSFSKYCAAVMRVNADIKRKKFNKLIKKIKKIEHATLT
jgi:hypothetical protein